MIKFLWAILFFCGNPTFGQPVSEKIKQINLPKTFKYNGKFKDGLTWTDKAGIHTVFISETGIIPSRDRSESDNRDAELFAYHYLKSNDTSMLVWKVYDGYLNCPVDVEAIFIKNTLAITDLNKDGNAEVWLMYKTVCHGDVSPSDLKIIMYENAQKFAARGTTRAQVSETEYVGGNYTFDKAFTNGPRSFRQYANDLWQKNKTEAF